MQVFGCKNILLVILLFIPALCLAFISLLVFLILLLLCIPLPMLSKAQTHYQRHFNAELLASFGWGPFRVSTEVYPNIYLAIGPLKRAFMAITLRKKTKRRKKKQFSISLHFHNKKRVPANWQSKLYCIYHNTKFKNAHLELELKTNEAALLAGVGAISASLGAILEKYDVYSDIKLLYGYAFSVNFKATVILKTQPLLLWFKLRKLDKKLVGENDEHK